MEFLNDVTNDREASKCRYQSRKCNKHWCSYRGWKFKTTYCCKVNSVDKIYEAALTFFPFISMRTKWCYITEQADTYLMFSKCRRSSHSGNIHNSTAICKYITTVLPFVLTGKFVKQKPCQIRANDCCPRSAFMLIVVKIIYALWQGIPI